MRESKLFGIISTLCLLFAIFQFNVCATGMVQVSPSRYSEIFDSFSKSKDAYVVEIDCEKFRNDKQFIIQLIKCFKIPFFLDEYELSKGVLLEDVVNFSDVISYMFVLDDIPESKVFLFLKNFRDCSFVGNEFDKELLQEALQSISKYWATSRDNMKDFSIFYS